jgi:TolB protein
MFKKILISFLLVLSIQAYALDLELTQGINAAIPVAVAQFGANDDNDMSDVVSHDLNLSGQFKVIGGNPSTTVGQFRQLGADSIVKGQVHTLGGGRYDVSYQLLDATQNGQVLLNRNYQVTARQLKALSHHISDEVYEKLTGVRGIFSTRIGYIMVEHEGRNARYTLQIADYDGNNPQSLLVSPEPILSPSWSPDGKKIAYVSFEKKRAQVYIVNVATGGRQLVTSFPGINSAPAWSPDGSHLAVVLSKSGSPKIYTVNLINGDMKQLTFGASIDTEPRYSPDGRFIIFTSGRGGGPQIYRMNTDGSNIARVTFDGNYNAKASYTPNMSQVVMLHREDRRFNIAAMDTHNGQVSLLTSAFMDESPSVSPNGRLILYATKANDKGVLGIVSIDGRIHMKLPSGSGDVQEPAWSPYLG